MRGWIAVLGFCVWAFPSPADACSTCASGDPTLTTLGAGAPYAGRVRLGLELQHRRETVHDVRLREERYALGLAYSPLERLTLTATLPFAYQRLQLTNLAEARRWSLGDASLRASVTLYQDRAFATRHLIAAIGGMEMPTATRPSDVPRDLQLGSRSWDALIGLRYGWYAQPISIQLHALLGAPLDDSDRNARTQLAGFAQWQPLEPFGMRAGLRAEVEKRTSERGGWQVDGIAGLMSRVGDAVGWAQLVVPLGQSWRGGHRADWGVELGVSVDL